MTQNSGKEYASRVNRSIDFIEEHLDHPFTLQELASVANFSRFHFNRIFFGVMGETPFQFITRVRMERAASWLRTAPRYTITDIACKCGYTDLAVFSRNFKSFFGVSATDFRKGKGEIRNISQMHGKHKQVFEPAESYFCPRSNHLKWRTKMKTNKSVEIKDLPEMTVAYIRHIGPYAGNEQLFEGLWNRLFTWAGPRNLIGGPDFKSLIIYHDDPNVTVEDKLRMSVCITVPADTKVEGEVGKMEIEKARYVVARFEVDATQFAQAWQWLYGEWFPKSGYQPDDKPCFEMYPEEPKDGKFTVDICVPVKPL